jgi:hypothetical protein
MFPMNMHCANTTLQLLAKALVCFGLMILSVSCAKEELSQEEINTRLLAGSERKIWLHESITIDGIEYVVPCVQDDHWTFAANKRVSRQSFTGSCPNLSSYETSIWYFNNHGKWLFFLGGTYEIVSLTETELVLSFEWNGSDIIDKFKKKP